MKVQWNAPVSLLINSMSASASEITAVSVKDQKAGKLYGHTSYGKGVMQNLFTLSPTKRLKSKADFLLIIDPKNKVSKKLVTEVTVK